MNNMMSTEYLEEVISLHNQSSANFWIDTNVPVHLRRCLLTDSDSIFLGSLKFTMTDQLNILK